MIDEDEYIYKLLIPAFSIPDNTTVTKKTGEKEYKIQRKLTIYDKSGEQQQEIIAKDQTAFLVSVEGRGDMNVISGDTEMVVYMNRWELVDFLNLDGTEDK